MDVAPREGIAVRFRRARFVPILEGTSDLLDRKLPDMVADEATTRVAMRHRPDDSLSNNPDGEKTPVLTRRVFRATLPVNDNLSIDTKSDSTCACIPHIRDSFSNKIDNDKYIRCVLKKRFIYIHGK